jgi:hypothetical protein
MSKKLTFGVILLGVTFALTGCGGGGIDPGVSKLIEDLSGRISFWQWISVGLGVLLIGFVCGNFVAYTAGVAAGSDTLKRSLKNKEAK